MDAYDTFAGAGRTGALKVVLNRGELLRTQAAKELVGAGVN